MQVDDREAFEKIAPNTGEMTNFQVFMAGVDLSVMPTAHPAPAAPAHPDDAAVDALAAAMKAKLADARAKGRSGWQTCPPEELSLMLREHVEKGDPRDVANFCAFLWALGAGISLPPVGTDNFDLWVSRGMGRAPAESPAAPVQQGELPDPTPYLPSAPCGTSCDWDFEEREAILGGMRFYGEQCARGVAAAITTHRPAG